MTKFIQYINEGATKIDFHKDLKKELEKNCKQAVKNFKKHVYIYRGYHNDMSSLLYTPSGRRQSAHTTGNYYTDILNNHPMWKQYPKREIICSTDYFGADGYGPVFYVFPYDNAKIGVCPTQDVWASFGSLDEFGMASLEDFNILMTNMGVPDGWSKYSSWLKKTKVGDLNKLIKEKYPGLLSSQVIKNYLTEFAAALQEHWPPEKSLYDFVTGEMDPKYNGFKVVNIKDFNIKIGEYEVWTDSKCIMVSVQDKDELKKIIQEIK